MQCRNCQTEFIGKYCPECGQKRHKRFNGTYLLGLFRDAFDLKHGFLHNLADLTVRPGEMIHGYIGGRTRHYLNPVTYFIITVTILTLVDGLGILASAGGSNDALFNLSDDWTYYQYAFIGICLLFGYTVSFILFTRYNWAESLIAALFASAHTILYSGILMALNQVLPEFINVYIRMLLQVVYPLWLLYSFFRNKWLVFIGKSMVTAVIILIPLSIGYLGFQNAKAQLTGIDNRSVDVIEKGRMVKEMIERNNDFSVGLSDSLSRNFHHQVQSYVLRIDSTANYFIYLSGGISEDRNGFLGVMSVISDRLKNDESAISNIRELEQAGKHIQDLFLEMNCYSKEEWFFKSFRTVSYASLENKPLIEILDDLYDISLDMLLMERECLSR